MTVCVKIIGNYDENKLQRLVNEALENIDVGIVDIKFSTCVSEDIIHFSALIIFNL